MRSSRKNRIFVKKSSRRQFVFVILEDGNPAFFEIADVQRLSSAHNTVPMIGDDGDGIRKHL
jgi:hypothetical protein